MLENQPAQPLKALFVACDQALAGLRPIVLSALQIRDGLVYFAGIGNVDVYGPPHVSRPPTVSGTVGTGLRGFREHALEVQAGHRWVLVSDGLRARDMAKSLSAVSDLEPQRAAQQLLELAGRADDDASALIIDFHEGP